MKLPPSTSKDIDYFPDPTTEIMAKNKGTVYLGFEDEPITDKYKSTLNCTVNKVGGQPDWPAGSEIVVPNCPICNMIRPLIVQIYAPLENSQFHRTLYIFACLNPMCSVISKTWLCIRTQVLDKTPAAVMEYTPENVKTGSVKINWCSGADEWDEPEDVLNRNEENGNVINKNDNRVSDDDDESNSMENDIICGMGNVNIDDKNANCGAQGGATGTLNSAPIYAEIEGEEFENVTVETPIYPERDLIAMLKQTPGIPSSNPNKLLLKSFFVSVSEEKPIGATNYLGLADHVRELIQEYQFRDENCRSSPDSPVAAALGACGGSGTDNEQEAYEHAVPAHGDVVFYNFMTTIQNNPGQIVRYSRDTSPLLPTPLNEPVPRCPNCGSDTISEVQILSTLIPKLRLENVDGAAPIEFGNVLIFTCLKSCWDTPDKMRLECALVQPEL